MGYSIKATLSCDGECGSCYENAIRAKTTQKPGIAAIHKAIVDLIQAQIKVKEAGGRICAPPTFHGGEPLMLSIPDLEYLAKKIHGFWGYNNIQTNGLAITDNHIKLFRKYEFHVGVSIDGDLAHTNRGRWSAQHRFDEFIQEKTDLVLSNLKKMGGAGVRGLSVIMVLRRYNALPEVIEDTKTFMLRLRDEFGITEVRQNAGIVYDPDLEAKEQLTAAELGAAYCELADFSFDQGLIYQPYMDIIDMLLGWADQTCVFSKCDPFHSTAEIAINYAGDFTGCLKSGAAIDGVQALRAESKSIERYNALEQIPQDQGGCLRCRYWFMCAGGCPGAAIDNDWRNKTRFCASYIQLFNHLYKKIKGMMPNLNLTPDLYPGRPDPDLVQYSLRRGSAWKKEFRADPENLKATRAKSEKTGHSDQHGDGHGDRHGDSPHGDHSDFSRGKK